MNKKSYFSIKTDNLSFNCFIISIFLSVSITILDVAFLKMFDSFILHQIFDFILNYFIITSLVYVILKQKNLYKKNKKLLYSSLKNGDYQIFIIDDDGKKIDVNPHFKELGIDEKEILGRHYCDLIKRLHN